MADAPVSYPFIWEAPHHDYIQWNGKVRNDPTGALGRNVGEVLGVFGRFTIMPGSNAEPRIRSTVRIPNLGKLETLLRTLWSPQWTPEKFITTNDTVEEVAYGKKLFHGETPEKFLCSSCHVPITREAPSRRVRSNAIPVEVMGVDSTAAVGFCTRAFENTSEPCPSAKALTDAVVSVVRTDAAAAGHIIRGTTCWRWRTRPNQKPADAVHDETCGAADSDSTSDSKMSAEPKTASYKARALNGIWATAPYLHNGSVPTLAHLLRPNTRPDVFFTGSREFLPDEIGFKYRAEDYPAGVPKSKFDTSRTGNLNDGHTYFGNYFETHDAEFRALMAYLRTL